MIICSQCNTRNRDDSTNCRNCGYYLNPPTQQQQRFYAQQSPLRDTQPPGMVDTQRTRQYPRQAPQDSFLLKGQGNQQPRQQPANQPDHIVEAYISDGGAQRDSGDNKLLMGVLGLVFIATLTALAYFFFVPRGNSNVTSNAVFAMAEDFYKEKDYVAALRLYQEFAVQFPHDPLAPIARGRVEEINNGLITDEEKNSQVSELLEKAQSAFAQSRYLKPDDDHAIMYISQILLSDPHHPIALDMQEKIINFYDEKAAESVKKGHYHSAKTYYENILQIVPNDDYATRKITTVSAIIEKEALQKKRRQEKARQERARKDRLKRQQQAKEKAALDAKKKREAELAQKAREEEARKQRLAEEKRRAAEAEERKRQLAELEEKRKNSNNRRSTVAANTTPTGNASTSNTKQPVQEKLDKTPALIVDEAAIDGGKRRYAHKEKAKLPQNWNYRGFSMVRAECIVRQNGTVESVKIISIISPGVSSDKYEPLINRTTEILKKYRYQPATIQGKPTRFKVVESITYKK